MGIRINELGIQNDVEYEINLYDADEAGKTHKICKVNGIEMTIHNFKRNKAPQKKAKGQSWLKKHCFTPD